MNPDLLGSSVARHGRSPCVVGTSRTYSFAEVDDRANRVVSVLKQLGIRRGETIALLAKNEPEFFELQLGCQRAGVTLATFNFWLAVAELEEVIHRVLPRLLVHGPGLGDTAAALDVRPTLFIGPEGAGASYEQLIERADATRDRSPIDPDAVATLLFTSGTSGRAKGVPMTNRVILARQAQAAMEVPIRPNAVFFQPQPMFHMSSQVSYACALMGATTVLNQGFETDTVADALIRHRVTHLQTVPTMLNRFMEEVDLGAVERRHLIMVLYGAAPMPVPLMTRTMSSFPGCEFLQWFGMTETSASSILRPPDHDLSRPELLLSVGTDSVLAKTLLVDEAGNECAPGEIGEIICRGPCVVDGYLDDPIATASAIRDGWMYTGDLGHRSDEGYLHLTSRLNDRIVSGGENVYPTEVEAALYRHPDVLEAAVIGRADDRWGEAVHAYVVLRPSAQVEPAELQQFCRSQIAGYKTPKVVHLVESLPKNAMGKILRRELRDVSLQ